MTGDFILGVAIGFVVGAACAQIECTLYLRRARKRREARDVA